MLSVRFPFARRQRPRSAREIVDRRPGSPAGSRPDPMPRLRWYA
jgi:hypothetical protein